MKGGTDTWFSGWTVSIILALLLAIVWWDAATELRAIQKQLETDEAIRLVDSLKKRGLLAEDGVLQGPLAALGTLPPEAGVADLASVERLTALYSTAQTSVAKAQQALRAIADSVNLHVHGVRGRLEQSDETHKVHAERLAAAAAALSVMEKDLGVALAATVRLDSLGLQLTALARQANDLASTDSTLNNDLVALGTAVNESGRALSKRVDGLLADLGALSSSTASTANDLGAFRKSLGEAQSELRGVSASLEEARRSSGEQVAAINSALEKENKAREALAQLQAQELAADRARIDAMAERLAVLEALSASLNADVAPHLGWRGKWTGDDIALGSLPANGRIRVSVEATAGAKGKLSLAIGSGEARTVKALLDLPASGKVDKTVLLPYDGAALMLVGTGKAEVKLSITVADSAGVD